MKNPGKVYKHLLSGMLLFALIVPYIEVKTKAIHVKPLDGAFTQDDNALKFSLSGWFSGSYQDRKEKVLNNTFGFRNIFIRTNNQVDYSLFNKAHAQLVVPGKEGYLFESHYIDGYYGRDMHGTNDIKRVVKMLQFISDTLTKLHKTLILVFAPNKAAYFPEYIPDKCKSAKGITAYDAYIDLLKNTNLHYIDFNNYFIANKYTSKYPLEGKNGIHWSMYGAALAGDSLIKYIEKVSGISMPVATWGKIHVGKDSLFDVDIEKSMNLLFKLPGPLMAYPEISAKNDSLKTRPNILTIGDSYFWGLTDGFCLREEESRQSEFLYYFKTATHQPVSNKELADKIRKADVIMLLATTHNWIDIGWGFIDNTYNIFRPSVELDPAYIKKLNEIKSLIKADNNWFSIVKLNAVRDHMSIDSALTINAKWAIEHQ